MAWIRKNWKSIAIVLLGLALMVFPKLAENLGKWWLAFGEWWGHHGELIGYVVEHLGAVLVVGMLIRVALEEGYQRAFLISVNAEVKTQIQESIDKYSKDALDPLRRSISDLGLTLRQLTYRIVQNLDENLRKVLEENVLNSPFVRPQYSIDLKLEPYPNAQGTSGILKASVGIRYRVNNRSDKPASYPVISWVDDLIRPENKRISRFTRFAYGPVDDRGLRLSPDFDIKSMEAKGNISEGNGRLNLRQNIDDITPGATYEVIVESEQLMREHDVFIWNVVTLTEKMDLTVELVGGLTQNDLEIRPTATHHAQDQAAIDYSDPTKITMQLHQVFLPYQGVEVRWSPRAAPTSPANAPPAPKPS